MQKKNKKFFGGKNMKRVKSRKATALLFSILTAFALAAGVAIGALPSAKPA
jgi:hypothetical protein